MLAKTVYMTCVGKGANSEPLCSKARMTIERVLTGSKPLIQPLDIDRSRFKIVRAQAPNPMPEGAASIDLDITERQHGLTGFLTVTVYNAQPLVFEQSMSIMDRNAPTHMDFYVRFLDHFIPSVLEQDNLN